MPVFPEVRPVTAGVVYGKVLDDELGYYCIGSPGSDGILRARFTLPQTIPSGQMTLFVRARANATSGNGVWNAKWGFAADGTDPEAVSLVGEGNRTIAWSAGDAKKYKADSVALDQDGSDPAGKTICMDFTLVNASYTLAVEALWRFWIDWT